ncbi:MAG: TlpA family protein disulfide reductase [Oceanococcus sp.]
MKYVVYVVVAVAALGIGFVLGGLRHQQHAPTQAPAFSVIDLNGEVHDLARYQDRLLLVNFWATWCAPCLKEIPRLQAAYERYADQGFSVLAPALDDTAEVSNFVAAHTMSYPVAVGDQTLFQLMDAFGDTLGALPFTVLIGRDGKILERHWGELSQDILDSYISEHL